MKVLSTKILIISKFVIQTLNKKMTTYLHGCRFWIISTAIPLASLSIKLIDPNTNAQLVYKENKTKIKLKTKNSIFQ